MNMTSLGHRLSRMILGRFRSAEGVHRARYGPTAPSLAALKAMRDDELVQTAAASRQSGNDQDAVYGEEFARRRDRALNPFLSGRGFRRAVAHEVEAARIGAADARQQRDAATRREANERLDDDGGPIRAD